MLLRKCLLLVAAFALCAARVGAYPLRGIETQDQPPGQTADWVNQRAPAMLRYTSPADDEYKKAIEEKWTILIGKIILDQATIISFYQRPRDPYEFLGSTIVVERRGNPATTYNVGDLLKDQGLAIAFVALVRLDNGETMLICNFESGATGDGQGFAVLRFTSSRFAMSMLPLTDRGKIVVFKSNPERAVVWSSEGGQAAFPTWYDIQPCRWEKAAYQCGPKKRKGWYVPNSVTEPGIEIRP